MCIMVLAVGAHPDFPFVLAHNRDEHFARAAGSLTLHGDVLCALDLQSGGTWMGANVRTGAVAALTNVRASPSRPSRSRGELVLRVLRGDARATTTREYQNYNLLHGELRRDGTLLKARLTVCAPPERAPRTHALPLSALPFVAAKSNDHGGAWTSAASDLTDDCTWPKAAWLQQAVASALSNEDVQAARGEAGARGHLLDAFATHLSATTMEGSAHAARASRVLPSQWSDVTTEVERRMQRAPLVTPFDLESNIDLETELQAANAPASGNRRGCSEASGSSSAAYGTVSQSVIVACLSEGCVFYAYREMKREQSETMPAAGKRGRSSFEGVVLRTRAQHREAEQGGKPKRARAGAWSWRRFELPSKTKT